MTAKLSFDLTLNPFVSKRIDIQVEMPSLSYDEVSQTASPAETSAVIAERVNRARAFAAKRTEGEKNLFCNAQLTPAQIRKFCVMDAPAKDLLKIGRAHV